MVILLGSAILIFTRLGHYPLWDDEAISAMTARAVWQTGDTSARVDDHNILAYRNGLLIRHLKDRFTPPLQFFMLAPVIGLFGESDFICRLPFAICGLITIGIIVRWLWRARPPPLVWWTAAVVILTSAELFLFARQCRYYALAMVLTTTVAYLYYHVDHRRRGAVLLSIALAALLASQYLNYAAAVACLVVDYALWGHRRRALSLVDWLILIVPQLVVGGIICSIWNPMNGGEPYPAGHWLSDRLLLLWWNWRDLIACDFVIVPLLALGLIVYVARRRDIALLRLPAALFVYIAVLAVLVATPVQHAGNAEVRYLAPTLPLCIGIAIVAVWGMRDWQPRSRATVLILAAASMFVRPFPAGWQPRFGSSAVRYYRELIHPQAEPYTPAIAWIRAHVSPGQSVLVKPDWMVYPLMFRAPNAVYAWQLKDPPTSDDYRDLPAIHFEGRVAPDYMIAFGPWRKEIGEAQDLLAPRGVRYQLIDTIPTYWQDLYRPELIWRSFVTIEPGEGTDVQIYRRINP